MLLMSVQPPISTIPCKTLYLLANSMLLFHTFSSPSASPTNPSRLPRPLHSNHCHPERSEGSAFRLPVLSALSVSALSSPDVSSFNFKLSTVNFPSLSPFPATLTANSQLTENSATLSPVPATLTSRVKHKSFICHSCKKHPGWGYTLQSNFFVAQISDLPVLPVTSHKSPVTASALFRAPVTRHQSRVTKSFTIRTSVKRARNSRRICTSKTQHLKPFRMNTYKKTGEGAQGGPYDRPNLSSREHRAICYSPSDAISLPTTHYPLFTCFSETTPLRNRQTTQRASVPREVPKWPEFLARICAAACAC